MTNDRYIDISPPQEIYRFFKKLNYKITTALSELIDNSVASFREDKFSDQHQINKITILFSSKNNRIII
jgi:hypothetical protein